MYGEHCPEGEMTIYSTQEVGEPGLLGSLHCSAPMATGPHPVASLASSLSLQTHPALHLTKALDF